MDFDNILYIIIVVVLAIVNGIVQKKKEARAQQAPAPKSFDPFAEEEGIEEQLEFIFRSRGKQPQYEVVEEPVSAYQGNGSSRSTEEYLDSAESPFDKPEAVSFEPIDVPEAAEFKPIDTYQPVEAAAANEAADAAFHFDDDFISKSSISSIDEEEAEVHAEPSEGSSLIKKHSRFNLREAIIYSEIITPKYFSPRNNLQLNY